MAKGVTVIRGVERLSIKESNRKDTIVSTLKSFGVEAYSKDGYIEIIGGEPIHSFIVCPEDHRIAMMASPLSLRVGGVIDRAECVSKSNPSFWSDLKAIGGRLHIDNERSMW